MTTSEICDLRAERDELIALLRELDNALEFTPDELVRFRDQPALLRCLSRQHDALARSLRWRAEHGLFPS